jgi:predicted nucleotidyltransferase
MSNNSALMDVLFTPARQRVLAILLLQPEATFHLRELARQTESHAGTLARELDKLTQTGLLLRSEQGNQVRYQANAAHPLFDELAAMFRKTHGMVPLLRETLLTLDARIDLAFVYGSMARGNATSGSDIDLLVMGKVSFTDLVRALHPLQAMLKREINPVLYSRKEFAARLARRDAFALEVTTNSRLWIKGTDDDLAKLAEH